MTPAAGLPGGPGRAVRALRAELRRTNFAGRQVSLAEGVAVWIGASAILAAGAGRGRARDAAVLAGIGALGIADDVIEPRRRRAGEQVAKGLRGHLGALRRGRLTTGGAKALGIPLLCLAAAAGPQVPRERARDRRGTRRIGRSLSDAVLAAGAANLANLLDLRPGRALKAVLVPAAVLSVPGTGAGDGTDADGRAVARAALVPALLALPVDLAERGMLGDCGANVLGAATGLAIARRAPAPVRLLALLGILALTLASERVSFSAVIDSTPALRAIDRLGRCDGGRP